MGEHLLERAPVIRVGRGPRNTEALLLADLDCLLAESAADPRLLATPVLVVVPSRGLRLHLAARIVRTRAKGVAGLTIRTLYGVACAILERVAQGPGSGSALVPVLAQRFARQHAALRGALGPLRDGYGAVVATVRDLLDAGFTGAHLETAEEVLGSDTTAELERARALLRVAAKTAGEIERLALADRSAVLARARDALRRDPAAALPARTVLIHGFAEATGVATDLLEALVQSKGGTVYLDAPPDPADPAREDLGIRFLERFRARMESGASALQVPPHEDAPSAIAVFQAAGTQAEVREVARRIRALLDGGERPEEIAVVARDLAPYRAALLQDFGRLAVPFSAGSARLRGPGARRAEALVALLRDGGQSTVDTWLAADARVAGSELLDLRLALRTLGAARVADVATLRPNDVLDEKETFALPLRVRHAAQEGDAAEEGALALRRKLQGRVLRAAVAAARSLAASLEAWPASAPVPVHLDALRLLLHEGLGWGEGAEDADVTAELEALGRNARADLTLARDEFLALLAAALAEVGSLPLGGDGGGVQVLSVVEARALTFEHLFVLGLNRDVFPHPAREDPLLPDRLRQPLVSVLPELPVKSQAFHEERYLFAQLLAASVHVTLSFQASDDDGKAVAASPFVERLRLAGRVAKPELAQDIFAEDDGKLLQPAHEALAIAGLHGTRAQFAALLPAALAEVAGENAQQTQLEGEAAARFAVLEELDPDRRTKAGRERAQTLGPYFGFIGAPGRHDRRRNDLYVTTLESMAGCPWQTFLRKLLGLEPAPDPLAALPALDPLTIGGALHTVLEGIVRAAAPDLPERLDEALVRAPVPVGWPAPETLAEHVRDAARDAARQAGWRLPMLARSLADVLGGYLEVARSVDWEDGATTLPVIGVEVKGNIEVADAAGTRRSVFFRVDRAERLDDRVRLTDYKSGRPEKAKAGTQHSHLLRDIARGKRLQAAAYVQAVRGEPVEARYLHLRPMDEGEAPARAVGVRGDDVGAAAAFHSAVRVLLQAWDAGSFFPRLTTPDGRDEGPRCRTCDVAEACLRQDSGARRRLVEWALRQGGKGAARKDGDAASVALDALWRLASGETAPEKEDGG